MADGKRIIRTSCRGCHGVCPVPVHLDDRLLSSVVHEEHAWWFSEEPKPDHGWQRSCENLLFRHEHFDPESGAELLKPGICRLEKIWRPSSGPISRSTPL